MGHQVGDPLEGDRGIFREVGNYKVLHRASPIHEGPHVEIPFVQAQIGPSIGIVEHVVCVTPAGVQPSVHHTAGLDGAIARWAGRLTKAGPNTLLGRDR